MSNDPKGDALRRAVGKRLVGEAMSSERHAIWALLDELQMNNRADAAKLVSLRSFMAGLELPDETRPKCDRCGITFAGQLPLAEHVHHSHDGPVPAHWLAIEARSDEAA